jgi:hypothetical protein
MLPVPLMKPPPWIHTITGAGFVVALAGNHTLRERQSSLVGPVEAKNDPPEPDCMQPGPNFVPSRGCACIGGGMGACHRRSFTGAAA